MSVFQLSQFLRKNEPQGAGDRQRAADGRARICRRCSRTASLPSDLFDDPAEAERLQLEFAKDAPDHASSDARSGRAAAAQGGRRAGGACYFPPDFGERLRRASRSSSKCDGERPSDGDEPTPIDMPEPEILYNSANEKSRLATSRGRARARRLASRRSCEQNLLASRVPANVARPFELKPRDVAEPRQQQAAVWSKILPFVLFIWALTGAFYPAVDLCAGEKERGTLETLLSSPALRSEIVWGKLLTVMTFSIATALLESVQPGLHGAICRRIRCSRCTPGDVDGAAGLAAAGVDRCGWSSRWCRCRRCSARCAWRVRRSPAARRKGSTT